MFNKNSVSTPCRPVLDASTNTMERSDGSGGRCLNDLVVKGRIDTLNLINLLLRFSVGLFAFSADIKQFYPACKLLAEQWNLQRFLWKNNLNPDEPTVEGIIRTLIYGVKSVSCQSECAIIKLAESIKSEHPDLALFLTLSRYVDDLADSKTNIEQCLNLIEAAIETFGSIGMEVKDWTKTGQDPSDKVSKDGSRLGVGGLDWFPKLDVFQVRIQPLHFGKPSRGRLSEKVPLFEGKFSDLEKFVPAKLTRRQVTSKVAGIYDPKGKFAPLLAAVKIDLRYN